ncbi:acetoacetate--CoA ligase [Janibacter cremeus]|uniref:acetoacetate--CoA ligase n=1 Tax=Janibacter cremeus TaxID=1285192 RepID=UPI0023F7DBCF|nr:acetoacetate--CoA ligase [Janibacter cremeus]WEV78733.1 acetoacetate--CoA ligase [Janibacter cremeus]
MERTLLWRPSPERIADSQIRRYQAWLAQTAGVETGDYADLHAWSVAHVDEFWQSIWDFFGVVGDRGDGPVRCGEDIQSTRWFPGAQVNFAQNLLRWSQERPDEEAIVGLHETGPRESVTWAELTGRVGALAAHLRAVGVQPGDRVCAVLPSSPETVVAMLATATVGATWSVVNTDFGVQGISDRFKQIEPRVLLTTDSIEFGGQHRDQLALLPAILQALPSVEHHVLIDTRDGVAPDSLRVPSTRISEILAEPIEPEFEPVEFSHPLWVLYSSGTTGRPKGIVHSHGGIVLTSLKDNALQYDLTPGSRCYYAVSTTWVVWNLLVQSMFVGVTIITYDGAPTHGSPARQLQICAEEDVEFFGTGAAILSAIERAGISPKELWNFDSLRSILSTGSPLPDSTWRWFYEHVAGDVRLGSDSGGTEIASGILGSNPLDSVYLGELMAPYLGVDARTVDTKGESVTGEVGELVMTLALPSMPIAFWNDPGGRRYKEAYFDAFDGLWRQGDWATRNAEGGWMIHGRSDATINRGGIRMGSADITSIVNTVVGVADSMVLGAELDGGEYYMPLFVVPEAGVDVDAALRDRIVATIREQVSPRYVPDEILAAPSIPRTRTGKILEVPIKRVFQGSDPDAVNRTAAADVASLEWYIEQATRFAQNRRSLV